MSVGTFFLRYVFVIAVNRRQETPLIKNIKLTLRRSDTQSQYWPAIHRACKTKSLFASDLGTHPAEMRSTSTTTAFAVCSLLISLLNLLSLMLLACHRNIGATTVTVLAMLANFMNFLNAAIWPNDNVSEWYSGVGLCDIEVKLQPIMSVAFPSALFCILKGLARVLDTKRIAISETAAQKHRVFFMEVLVCGILPLLQAVSAWIVQPLRFFVFGIAGCSPAVDQSWLTPLLLSGPKLLWTLACVYFAVVVLVRLIIYRRTVTSMLTHHNTSKARFTRLYILCVTCIVGVFPLEIWLDYRSITSGTLTSFDWQETHRPTTYDWNSIISVPSHGIVPSDRYIWLAGGVVIFLIFGSGGDAMRVYRRGLSKIGLDRFLPSPIMTPRSDQSCGPTTESISRASLLSRRLRDTWSSKRSDSISETPASARTSTSPARHDPPSCDAIELGVEPKDVV